MGIAADLSLDEKILENIAIELILDQIQLALEISSKWFGYFACGRNLNFGIPRKMCLIFV